MKAQAPPPSNLPVQLTSFVGREAELDELADVLRTARLLTIAGAPGLGKTRLALEVAGRALPELPDGAWFVGLAALADPALVPREVATALGVREQFGEHALDTLPGHVGQRRMLLLLDNCEHLLDACARLAESLLRACPGLRVMCTSHEPLRVPGERVWRIAPLGLPDGAASLEALGHSEAVRLFLARAGLVQPQFGLTPANADAVARLCRRLDGIPLAIELAAARVEMMSVSDIVERLEDRFRLLTGGSRTAMPRHQTLRAALDWGHHLLNDDERKLFRRLSVFPGTFELAAAEAVCAGPDLAADAVLGHLTRLVDKSLVVPEALPSGHTRYRMLETVRQYAAERLLEVGEGEELRSRHAGHVLELAERASHFERRPGQAGWLERLEADHDDLRAALQWCRAHDHARWARLALALGWFWLVRGHLSEGREWLQAVQSVPTLAPADRAWGLFWLARLALWQGEYGSAAALGEAGLAGFRELGDGRAAGWMLNLLSSVYTYAGDFERGRACLDELLASGPDADLLVDALMSLGELLLLAGDVAGARVQLERCLVEASGTGARWHVANGTLFLAVVDYLDRDLDRARAGLADALDVFRQMGNRYALSWALDFAGALAITDALPERALRLCGAAAALREAIRAPLAPRWQELVRSTVLEPARAMVGAGRADAAWAEGGRLDLEEAVAEADVRTRPAVAPGGEGAVRPGTEALSRREREVALLVARGLTNRQIAHQLVIAERTVEGHLERIRGKLGLSSRTQIAVWVVERGRLG